MKYYIIAGEASGDLHGSNLMKALKQKDANFTALTAPYEEPKNPDLFLDTSLNNVEQTVQILTEYLRKKYSLFIS